MNNNRVYQFRLFFHRGGDEQRPSIAQNKGGPKFLCFGTPQPCRNISLTYRRFGFREGHGKSDLIGHRDNPLYLSHRCIDSLVEQCDGLFR